MRLTTIVVGMDFSEPAIRATKWVMGQFAPDSTVVLTHVIAPPDRPRFWQHELPPPEEVEATAREWATSQMHEVSTFLTAKSLRSEIRVGKPYVALADVARETGADLVVIGPHGDRPHRTTRLGTTADRLVRTSPVPILIAREPGFGPPRKILVPVDDFDITPRILTFARDLGETFAADVTLLHVWSNAVYSDVASMSHAKAPSEAKAQHDIRDELRDSGIHWLEELASTGFDRNRVSAAVTYGNPGDATVEMAAAMEADLIILGRRGSGLIAPMLLGSTLNTVLHDSKCPVLVVTEAPADGATTR